MSIPVIPRPEHPNPQWKRSSWQNLNGTWEFGYSDAFGKNITVPFCPESELSGIGNKDFMNEVWYRREIDITPEQLQGCVMLHFGAADYETRAYVNGQSAGTHKGGYTSFSFDITALLNAGKNTLAVQCKDDTRDPMITSGKQSERLESYQCMYTRTTGIWQTVWLEFTPKNYIVSAVYQPDVANNCLHLRVRTQGDGTVSAKALWQGKEVGQASANTDYGFARFTLPLSEAHLWEVGKGGLYDLEFTFGDDKVQSYFGLRSLAMDGFRALINGKSVFQRLILDQGFYPDGIYTAPTAEALENDIKLSMAAGFNGARLHQKVFEPLFLYYCDLYGYIVWGEFASWGIDHSKPEALHHFLPQWCESVERDRNHPAIVGWCPFNESWDINGNQVFGETLRAVYQVTKHLDPDRPCIDTSGNYHVETDIYDLHDYEQDVATFKKNHGSPEGDYFFKETHPDRQKYTPGLPVFMSEYGGIGWDGNGISDEDRDGDWGYGKGPEDAKEFLDRYKGLTDALLDNPKIMGFCYTQLTDVEQEKNGIYTYERKKKFDTAFFYEVNMRKAAIED